MSKPITPEMIAAWRTLQTAAAGGFRLQPEVRRAINTLDNSDFMVPIEEAGHDLAEAAKTTFEYTVKSSGVDAVTVTVHNVDDRGTDVVAVGIDIGKALLAARRSMVSMGFIAPDQQIMTRGRDAS